MKHLSSFLPILLATTLVTQDVAKCAEPPQLAVDAPITYASVDEALKALRAKPGVTFRSQDGWMVAEDQDALTSWLITPPGHPAYPSLIRRALINKADGAYMDTKIRCFASKDVCDRYFGGK